MSIKKMTSVFTVLLLAVFTMSLSAQTVTPQQQQQGGEITDADLKKYAKVSKDLEEMQKGGQADQKKIVKDHGMEVARFSEISRAKQSGQDIEMTAEEEAKFKKISQKLQEYNKQHQQKAMDILKKHNMQQQKYMQIRQKLRQDKELQKRLQAIQK
ncbi:MAG: DUF4168 domain-containing protein [Bacteroidales bacterium]|nr:DUF4168 domain-containing protein [Bacteroidales bacterium]MCF8328590.1 DUF4168 domain-containing protein [Bacteroidales bacterium]